MSFRPLTMLLTALALAAPFPASAQELSADQENSAIVYAWDNAVYTMYHEIGHMLIDLYELPVLAKEEDAVDNLATLMALEDYNRDGDPIITDAAYGWMAWMRNEDISSMSASDFFDEHSISTQRAFQMICVLGGSDREEFGHIAAQFGLDSGRMDRCEAEYEQTRSGWEKLLKPHYKANTGKPMITVVYGEAGKDTTDARDILIDNDVLHTVARTVEARYTLPSAVTFQAMDCGSVNAYWSLSDTTIILCYEIVEDYYDQYRRDLLAGRDPTAIGLVTAETPAQTSANESAAAEPDGDGTKTAVTAPAGTLNALSNWLDLVQTESSSGQ